MGPKPTDEKEHGRYSEAWWNAVAKDLAAYKAEQRQTWGDTDENLIACYVAGTCTRAERVRVEQAMKEYPAVRECVDVVRSVMAEDAPPAAGDDAGQKGRKGKPSADRDSGPVR